VFETLIVQMDRIVPETLQENDRLGRDPHVGQELYAAAGSIGCTVSSASQAA
jgi:hypothetical protein